MQKGSSRKKMRVDYLVVEGGWAQDLKEARAMIMAAEVIVGGQVVDKPGSLLPRDVDIRVKKRASFVGRGGEKLVHALTHFALDPKGLVVLDVGASTGGFTDCLLQRGSAKVYALDVGKGQLHFRLRKDPRVVVREGINARYDFDLPERVEAATVDVAFISITKVLLSVACHVVSGGQLVCLIKPQFEAARQDVPMGGVVKDPLVHGAVLANVGVWAIERGFRVRGITPSPILGDKGNREFFMLLEMQ